MKNKTSIFKSIAIIAGVIGAVTAVAAFVKSKSSSLNRELDFDDMDYFDHLEDPQPQANDGDLTQDATEASSDDTELEQKPEDDEDQQEPLGENA